MRPSQRALLIAGIVALWTANGVAQPTEPTFQLNIAAQPIDDALQEFARQAGLQVFLATADGKGVTVSQVVGIYTAPDALAKLLSNTGLHYEYIDARTVAIRAAKSSEPTGRRISDSREETDNGIRLVQATSDGEAASSSTGELGGQRSGDAVEESQETKLEEVVVTAQKREEQSIDVPMSITAISGDKLTAAGITNALDLSYAVPSLAVSETQPGRQMITIRGIGSERGSSSLTGLYLDEMPVTGARGGAGGVVVSTDLRVIDLERVEVLKGPQGTLFGEGAAGGVLRFITKDPDLGRYGGEAATKLSSTADGGWSKEILGIANLPLSQDVFGIRLAVSYQDEAGWIDQPSIGREDINDTEVRHARLKALYAPTSELRIKGLVEIHRNDGGAQNLVNLEPRKGSNFLQAYDRFAPTDYRDDYDAFNLTVTYDLGFAELLSSTSRLNFENTNTFTQLLDGNPRPWLEIVGRANLDATITSQELRLTSTTRGPFNWSIGAAYKDNEFNSANDASGVNAVVGAFGYAVLERLGAGQRSQTTSESWATFANASYQLTSRVQFGGGLRYFQDRRSSSSPSQPTMLTDDFNKLTFRTYLKLQATESMNLYVNVASGFRSGGFNNAADTPRGTPPSYDSEDTIFYELGTKMALLDGRGRFDAALFYGEYKNMQEDTLVNSPVDGGPIQFTANGQDAEVKGVEWELGWLVTDRLALSLSGDVTDSEISWVDPNNPIAPFFVGDPVNFVPKYGVSATADYKFKWGNSVPGFFNMSFNMKGKSYCTDRFGILLLDKQGEAPDVSFLNASLGGEWNGWNVSLFGRNLLDEYRAINASQTGWSAQARPRTIGIGVSKSL